MLKRLDSFFIRVVTADNFSIDFDRLFPPGSQIHATTSLSRVGSFGANPTFFAIAGIVAFSVHLNDGSEGPIVFVQNASGDQNAISVANCARLRFSLHAQRADAKALINIYTF